MTDTFDPGPGWREVTVTEWGYHPTGDDSIRLQIDGKPRYWVAEEPKKPLPTEPGFVIHIPSGKDEGFWMKSDQGWWLKWGSDTTMQRQLEYDEFTIKCIPAEYSEED